jgi:hypothetical protein
MCQLSQLVKEACLDYLNSSPTEISDTSKEPEVYRKGRFIVGQTYYTRKNCEFVAAGNSNGKIIPVVLRKIVSQKVKRGAKWFLEETAICEHGIARNQKNGRAIPVVVRNLNALHCG